METAWTATAKPGVSYPPLRSEGVSDVAIVGGGLTGLLTAYLLAKEGMTVKLFEKKRIGMDTTAFTTAFLTHVMDTSLTDLISMFGEEGARLIWESHAAAIDLLEGIAAREKIKCEFVRVPAWVYANKEKEVRDLLEEKNSAARIGFKTSLLSGDRLGFRNAGAWEIPRQAKFHPLKFVFGLARAVASLGVAIHEKTEVMEINDGSQPALKLKNGRTVRANHVMIMTYYPFNKPRATFLKKGMYVSYVIEANIPKESLREGIYFDLANPYHYFRVDPAGRSDRVILGGADHREELKISAAKNYRELREHMTVIFPFRKDIVRKWTGPILEPSDGIALIGETKRRQFVATAFSGNGMTYAGISALMARDWVLGKKNAWEKLYDPKRKLTVKRLIRKAADYTGEFMGGALKNALRPSR